MPAAITLTGLRKSYGRVVAVDGIDLTVQHGECFGLLGPNGAGKTTTMEILEGLLDPTSGQAMLLGRGWAHDRDDLRKRIGVVLQDSRFSDRLTVEEILRIFRSFYSDGADLEVLLEELQLAEKRRSWVSRLSGGQRQRLAVACGLVGNPELLFLDEPTTGLDPQSRRALWEILKNWRARGKTILITTHYMDEAERLCDRVAIIDRGKIIALGTPAELIRSLGDAHFVELTTEPPVPPQFFSDLTAVSAVRTLANGLSLSVTDPAVALPEVLKRLGGGRVQLTSLALRHGTLEDVFVTLTGRQLRDE
jgi:ABC-2 type transport system ATP-binding protein